MYSLYIYTTIKRASKRSRPWDRRAKQSSQIESLQISVHDMIKSVLGVERVSTAGVAAVDSET